MADVAVPNPTVLQLQKFLQGTRPFGIGYGGPLDGRDNPDLIGALNLLQNTLAVMLGEPLVEKLVNGKKSSPNAMGIISKHLYLKPQETPIKDPTKDLPKDKELGQAPSKEVSAVLNLQKLMSGSLPVVGKLYAGPIDGQMNEEYKSALSKLIQTISKFVGKNVQKEISSTTAEDINEALKLMATHQVNNAKPAEFTGDQRFVRLSQLMIELKSKKI